MIRCSKDLGEGLFQLGPDAMRCLGHRVQVPKGADASLSPRGTGRFERTAASSHAGKASLWSYSKSGVEAADGREIFALRIRLHSLREPMANLL